MTEPAKAQAAWAEKLKVKHETANGIGMTMVLIPPSGDLLTRPYWMGKYEVTQAEWQRVMKYNPSANQKGTATNKFPVASVSWYDAVEFCNKLSEKEGLKPYYAITVTKRDVTGLQIDEAEVKILGGSGYRLPTDIEWSHACRAGATTKYHFGDDPAALSAFAWFKDNSGGKTHAVGESKPNVFGLHDLHGNALEWNEEMAARGGCADSDSTSCVVGIRVPMPPAGRGLLRGLRVARSGDNP